MPKSKKEGKILNKATELPVDKEVLFVENDTLKEDWKVKDLAAQSETKITDDKGEGNAVKLFFFDYSANPQTFKEKQPTAQELFNIHIKEMEVKLWSQGWKPFTDVEPRLLFSKNKRNYRFIIGALPVHAFAVKEKPKTLSEILTPHGRPAHRL